MDWGDSSQSFIEDESEFVRCVCHQLRNGTLPCIPCTIREQQSIATEVARLEALRRRPSSDANEDNRERALRESSGDLSEQLRSLALQTRKGSEKRKNSKGESANEDDDPLFSNSSSKSPSVATTPRVQMRDLDQSSSASLALLLGHATRNLFAEHPLALMASFGATRGLGEFFFECPNMGWSPTAPLEWGFYELSKVVACAFEPGLECFFDSNALIGTTIGLLVEEPPDASCLRSVASRLFSERGNVQIATFDIVRSFLCQNRQIERFLCCLTVLMGADGLCRYFHLSLVKRNFMGSRKASRVSIE